MNRKLTRYLVVALLINPILFAVGKLFIEIPADINTLQRENPELATKWREVTRWAFTEAIASGYLVEEFYGLVRRDQPIGTYLLSYGKRIADFL